MGRLRRTGGVFVVLVVLAGGCRSSARVPDPMVRPDWRAVSLPAPAGPPGRVVVRDVADCGGRWFLVGAVADAAGATRPAAWTSLDARAWTPLSVRGTSFYGRQNVLSAVGCRGDRMAAIGAKRGGAHGNLRVSTWRQVDEHRLVEVAAPFELYGGPEAVDVSRIAGGSTGWLMVGNRSSGAAAWLSPDSARFDLVAGVPELAGDGRGRTLAFDVVATGGGWLAVGSVAAPGRIDPDPVVWTSLDGRRWRRVMVPGADGSGELQRVTVVGATPVAVGLRGDGFGAWREGAGGWEAAGRVGGSPGGSGLSGVRGLTAAGDQVVAAISSGDRYALWLSADLGRSWRPMAAPPSVTASEGVPGASPAGGAAPPSSGGPLAQPSGGLAVAVAGGPNALVVTVDAGAGAAVWSAAPRASGG